MNTELKALISLIFDGVQIGQSAVAKENVMLMLPQIFQALSDIAPAIMNYKDIPNELKDLSNPANEADISSFIQSKFGGVLPNNQIVTDVLALIKSIVAIVQDIIALKAAKPV